jgi:hypothetical protein
VVGWHQDRAQLSAQVEQFKKSLGHSLRMAENHLAKRGSKLTGEGEGGRQQLFVRNLQSVAEAHGLQLYACTRPSPLRRPANFVGAFEKCSDFLMTTVVCRVSCVSCVVCRVSLAVDPSEMGMEVATKTLSASISGQHFLVDVHNTYSHMPDFCMGRSHTARVCPLPQVHVTLQGHVDKVNVTFTSTAGT